jgi:hypothetical protein
VPTPSITEAPPTHWRSIHRAGALLRKEVEEEIENHTMTAYVPHAQVIGGCYIWTTTRFEKSYNPSFAGTIRV